MLNYSGVLVGGITFLLIGIFHPIVIHAEYYLGKKSCWLFLLFGIFSLIASVFTTHNECSSILAVLGFTCLWSIKEVFEQIKRVEKGWYPKNPKKKD